MRTASRFAENTQRSLIRMNCTPFCCEPTFCCPARCCADAQRCWKLDCLMSLRRLQDWDLWLRMLRADMMFVGVQRCLVRYRAHPHSLSADTVTGNLGRPGDCREAFWPRRRLPEQWSAHKRLAYGGVYRFQAIDALLRHQDWSLLQSALIHALRVDPTLATDESLFYELALGTNPSADAHRQPSANIFLGLYARSR